MLGAVDNNGCAHAQVGRASNGRRVAAASKPELPLAREKEACKSFLSKRYAGLNVAAQGGIIDVVGGISLGSK